MVPENTKIAFELIFQIFTNIEKSLKTFDERYKLADAKLVVGNMQFDFLKTNEWFIRVNVAFWSMHPNENVSALMKTAVL